jgi:AraC-like DNA-binding protein
MPVEYHTGTDDPLQYCWVGFNGADARLLVDAAGFSPENPVIRPRSPEKASELILDIYQNRGQKLHRLIGMTARLYTLLACLIEDSLRTPSAVRNGLDHVERACEYIAKNYSRNISVGDIAGHVYLSPSRLYRVFMQHVSMSPQQYLTEFRIRKACELMQKQQGAIKEIAYAVGIDDPLYFSTIFKRIVGQTPSNYMKKIGDHNLYSEVEVSAPQPSPEVLQQIGSQAGTQLAKMFLEHPAEFSRDRKEMLQQLKQYLGKAVDEMIGKEG